jgi:pyrroloquinoline quinone (PQQ) biosynthesis protein C
MQATMMSTSFESELRTLCDAAYQRPSPPDNPMLRLLDGRLSRAEAQEFWLGRWDLVLILNQIVLPRLLEHCPDVDARVALWSSIYPEYGNGRLRHAHPILYQRFLRALGVPAAACPLQIDRDKRSVVIRIAIVEAMDWLELLGRFLARETVGPKVFPLIEEGLARSFGLGGADLDFFTVHSRQDQEDADTVFKLAARYGTSPVACQRIRTAAANYFEAEPAYCRALGPITYHYAEAAGSMVG